ncbi:MAG: TIGR04053 family radical SAM/SPASM domain-containing protein [Candidatus Omnitrophica bacterium]|nr:TIGR04053 family radical SAM/SPASM domain-containing protein [Candidatus Omnitrophota bacterium]MBI2495306.1 TIGR04053 family radical SAM/SPASM domain-containing protein [Candidatus Omnitrophota bacterium]MBI3020802.1 TIGR04053 family radical SAM/SPASM domain-containing protein [Candidatus Omnitrophota bacterium]MBI3083897.1 TIGR04053 family radical SAM/SPASM domain-containing protein [Candidatus Omnitrophota bacterium]
MDLNQSPFIVIWETTQACDLACVHCRAEAQPNPLPGELTHAEGLDLIDHVARLGTRVLVLSGGDPLKRRRLTDLIRHGKARKLRMGTIPAATPRLTREAVNSLKDAGLDQMAVSLDASTAEAHDRFRGAPGAFQKTMEAVGWAHETELPLQINTVMSALNFEDLDRLIELVRQLGIVFWEVFFLVPVGRGTQLAGLTAEQYELVFAKLYETARAASFVIKVTEALHYRRYSIERQGTDQPPAQAAAGSMGERWRDVGPHGSIGISPQSINAGKGHLFISSTGEVYPSGFLPLSAGNIRATSLARLYRASPLFLALRNPDLLKGRCGICEFRSVCGGSRSRAYALTGDVLAEDPCCAYVPRTPSLSA